MLSDKKMQLQLVFAFPAALAIDCARAFIRNPRKRAWSGELPT